MNLRDSFRQAFEDGEAEALAATDELPLWSAPFGMALLDRVRLQAGMKVLGGLHLEVPFLCLDALRA